MIEGAVKSGMGMASRAIVGERLRNRGRVFCLKLVPGTLNVRVPNLQDALDTLGEPHVRIHEPWSTVGTLRAWRVRMSVGDLPAVTAWVTRGEASRAGALETMAAVHWRTLGAKDGDAVTLTLDP